VLAHLYPHLRFTRELGLLFARLRERFSSWPNHGLQGKQPSPEDAREQAKADLTLCYLALLTSGMSLQELDGFVRRLHCSSRDARLLHEVARLREMLGQLQATVMLPSSIDALLSPFSREARFVISVLADSEVVRQRLDLYERALAPVTPRIDGHFLRSLGVPPGPIYGEILARVRSAVLDGQVTTLEEERALARSLAAAAHPAHDNASPASGPRTPA